MLACPFWRASRRSSREHSLAGAAASRAVALWSLIVWTPIVVFASTLALWCHPRGVTPNITIRGGLYAAVLFLTLPACYWVFSRVRSDSDEADLNKTLDQNVALLVAAFVLVMMVMLIMAQLGSALGMGRALSPDPWLLVPELVGFALAIVGTLIGRGLRLSKCKKVAVALSSSATLACFLLLAPYFWYQRQELGAPAIVQSALGTCRPESGEFRPIEDLLLAAAGNRNYHLLREGANQISATVKCTLEYHDFLCSLERHVEYDPMALNIVQEATRRLKPYLDQTPESTATTGHGEPRD